MRPVVEFRKNGVNHTNTFVLIGDSSGTTYLAAIDLSTNTIETENSYDLTQVRRKIFNGVPVLMTTINTHIALSATVRKKLNLMRLSGLFFRAVF